MNKPLWGVVAVLVVSLGVFAAVEHLRPVDEQGEPLLKTSSLEKTLFTPDSAAQPLAVAATSGDDAVADEGKGGSGAPAAPRKGRVAAASGTSHSKLLQNPPVTDSLTILFVGDSMLEGLGPRMAAYAKHNGYTLINVIWYSSTTEIWGRSTRLQDYVRQYKPDFVLVSLGANELFVRDIKQKRQQYVDNMLRQMQGTPYVWIGPPNWKPDTGINDMLQASCAPGSFYLSNGEHFDRAKDGAHPTRASASAWADRVCKWIATKSAHPFPLNVPTEARARCKTIVHQPER
ncbi:MAG: SGNH/GDSL hydrolase family protein [Muribaculaceae bacterium]|nr:SGNH/GDSL hydrolase family protein [Muribaculaceae bacterium]